MLTKERLKTVLIVLQVAVTVVLYFELRKSSNEENKSSSNIYSKVDSIDYEVKILTTNQTSKRTTTSTSSTTSSTSTTTVKVGECPETFYRETIWDQLDEIIPKYNLRKDRFLMHILSNGPNNQIADLKKALYFSIKLNRTFVMPLFFEHSTIPHNTFIYPENRIRPRLVAQLVTSVDPRKMNEFCPDAKAIMFESPTQQLKGMRMDRQDWLEKYHGITIHGSRDPPQIVKEYPIATLAQTTFPYDDKCATHPFKNVQIPLDDPIDNDIKKALRRPMYIQQMVRDFINLHFGGSYGALHWRYDRKDFLSISRCAKFSRIIRDTSILTYEKACHLFLPIFARPAGFADDIVRTLRKQKLKHIYIAAPPSEQVFIDDLSEELEKRKIHVLTYQQVKQFFDQNYPNCDHFKFHREDTLSLFDQEVCYQSDFFVRSLKSTWSFNIFAERELHQMLTIDILDVLSDVSL